jgi:hypothetical protein
MSVIWDSNLCDILNSGTDPRDEGMEVETVWDVAKLITGKFLRGN